MVGSHVFRFFGILFAAVTLVLCSLLLVHATHGTTVYWFGNWYPRGSMVLGIGFVVDTIGAGLATLAALLTFLALLFSWRFIDSGSNHFQPLMLVFLAAMCGFSLTGDLFNLFVFFELMSTAAFALCGLKTAEPAPLQGSFNFAVTNTIAAFLILTGIALLYAMTGALNMAQIGLALGARHDPLVLFAFTLLTCGFLIKGAIVPFHLWLPDAHAVAPTPVCVLFSGLMVELGLYAVVRLHSVIFAEALASHSSRLRWILILFAATSVVISGLMCYSEHHLKRLLAFSTVCHASLMLLAFAMLGPLAIAAMLTYLLGHALIKSGLFFVSGMMLHRLRSINERILFGKGVKLRWTAGLWFLGAIGLAAAPPFSLMLGELEPREPLSWRVCMESGSCLYLAVPSLPQRCSVWVPIPSSAGAVHRQRTGLQKLASFPRRSQRRKRSSGTTFPRPRCASWELWC